MLFVLVLLQLADLSPALMAKNTYFNSGRIEVQTPFASSDWETIGSNYQVINMLSHHLDYGLAVFSGQRHMTTNQVISNRGDYSEIINGYSNDIAKIVNGEALDENTVYLTNDPDLFSNLIYLLDPAYMALDLGNFKAIFMGQSNNHFEGTTFPVQTLMASQLTDDKWENGISKNDPLLLLPYWPTKESALRAAKRIKVGEYEAEILNVTVDQDKYIILQINGEKERFAYPQVFQLVP